MNSVRKAIPILALAIAVAVSVGVAGLTRQNNARAQYFGETGHTVREPFLTAYEEMGGLEVLGFPISDSFADQSGTTVQYFQNARLEQTPTGVQLGPLGDELGLARPPNDLDDTEGVLFDETSHYLAPAFVSYYQAHNGETQFGPPINSARIERNLLVQDFERVRLVRDTSLPPGQQVRLGNLGSIALTVTPLDGTTILASPPRAAVAPTTSINASVSVAQPTLQNDAPQTVYVYVVSRSGGNEAVAGAKTFVHLRYEGGLSQIEMPPTDANGISSATFQPPPAPPGTKVMVEAHVVWGEAVASISTIYLQWW